MDKDSNDREKNGFIKNAGSILEKNCKYILFYFCLNRTLCNLTIKDKIYFFKIIISTIQANENSDWLETIDHV